jgi:hypothetical protein
MAGRRAPCGRSEDDVPHHVTGYGCGGPERPDPPAVERVLRAVARASVVAAVRRLVARLPPRPLTTRSIRACAAR